MSNMSLCSKKHVKRSLHPMGNQKWLNNAWPLLASWKSRDWSACSLTLFHPSNAFCPRQKETLRIQHPLQSCADPLSGYLPIWLCEDSRFRAAKLHNTQTTISIWRPQKSLAANLRPGKQQSIFGVPAISGVFVTLFTTRSDIRLRRWRSSQVNFWASVRSCFGNRHRDSLKPKDSPWIWAWAAASVMKAVQKNPFSSEYSPTKNSASKSPVSIWIVWHLV